MSWSFSISMKAEEIGDVEANRAFLEANHDKSKIGNEQAVEERDQQVTSAIDVAAHLLVSGIYDKAKEVTVNCVGHANKGFYGENAAHDSVQVNVYIKEYKPLAESA